MSSTIETTTTGAATGRPRRGAPRAGHGHSTTLWNAVPWTLRKGDTVLFTMPRYRCVRNFVLNHLIHHRAQLTVYLRENDVAVPGMYGPTADEGRM